MATTPDTPLTRRGALRVVGAGALAALDAALPAEPAAADTPQETRP